MILFYGSDLTWAVRIKSTADALGVPARPVRSIDMLEARLADEKPSALLVDLDNPEVGLGLIERAAAENRARSEKGEAAIRVVAFGPHVAKDTLQAARDAGAHDVLPRGAFANALPDLLTRLASGG